MMTESVVGYEVFWSAQDNVVTIRTDMGAKAARRFAEFECEKDVMISLIFSCDYKGVVKDYRFRYGALISLPDKEREDTIGSIEKGQSVGAGCPHSRRGDPAKCSQCGAKTTRDEIRRLILEGKL